MKGLMHMQKVKHHTGSQFLQKPVILSRSCQNVVERQAVGYGVSDFP